MHPRTEELGLLLRGSGEQRGAGAQEEERDSK